MTSTSIERSLPFKFADSDRRFNIQVQAEAGRAGHGGRGLDHLNPRWAPEFTTFSSSFPISPIASEDTGSYSSDTEADSDGSPSPYSSPFLDELRHEQAQDSGTGTAVPDLSFQFGSRFDPEHDDLFVVHQPPKTAYSTSGLDYTPDQVSFAFDQPLSFDFPMGDGSLLSQTTTLRRTSSTSSSSPVTKEVTTESDGDVTMKVADSTTTTTVLDNVPSLTSAAMTIPEAVVRASQVAKNSDSKTIAMQSEEDDTDSVTASAPLPTSRKRTRSPSRRVTRHSTRRHTTQDDDDVITIGEYTKAERRAKIARFMEKRKRRKWTHGLMLKCRQVFATNRPRVNGRFVKLPKAICPLIAKGVDMRGYDLNKPAPAERTAST